MVYVIYFKNNGRSAPFGISIYLLVILIFQGTSFFKVIRYIAYIIIYNYYVTYKYNLC